MPGSLTVIFLLILSIFLIHCQTSRKILLFRYLLLNNSLEHSSLNFFLTSPTSSFSFIFCLYCFTAMYFIIERFWFNSSCLAVIHQSVLNAGYGNLVEQCRPKRNVVIVMLVDIDVATTKTGSTNLCGRADDKAAVVKTNCTIIRCLEQKPRFHFHVQHQNYECKIVLGILLHVSQQ